MSVSPDIAALLLKAKSVAVVGLSNDPFRPSHFIAEYLQRAGYWTIGVHPGGGRVLGMTRFSDLEKANAEEGPIDVVDIFRRSEAVAELLPALLAIRPKLVWMQLGVTDQATADALEAAGIRVVQDQCIAVVHRALVARP